MTENRLGRETSPYLLQHKDNPVHWWAWGPEALAESKRIDKPILLSIGYAACHWCHVMAHESFEDGDTAAVMNEHFVNIKLDREERPDIDAIYMSALHRLGEQGGWPLTMFLDSEARPFWGGTYFPKTPRYGKPAFADILHAVSRTYRQDRARVADTAEKLAASLRVRHSDGPGAIVSDRLVSDLASRMARVVDPVHGGIAGAPKFPQWSFFWLLWRAAIRYGDDEAKHAVLTTLTRICQGGIYDHLGGGFARYSVDERWLAPHFEKMLYDNALLIHLLTEAWRETQDPLFRTRVAETVDWLLREMVAEGGGFAASLDADSEGEEGKFYVWSEAEILDALGEEDGRFFASVYDVTAEGNWEGHNILNRLGALSTRPDEEENRLAACREKLLSRRAARIRPGWDDKVLADWNGLMIAALARASQVFGQPPWLQAAEDAFAFVDTRMTTGGRLMHSHRAGRNTAPATASDYAGMIWAALRLFEATGRGGYLERARAWAAILDARYWEPERGGYATAADDTGDVIVRLVSAGDDATPSANAVMVSNLAALFLVTEDGAYLEKASAILRAFAPEIARFPVNHTGLLANALDVLAPQQVVIATAARREDELQRELHRVSLPGALEFVAPYEDAAEPPPGLAKKTAVGGKAAAYVCFGPQCAPPVTEPEAFAKLLRDERAARQHAKERPAIA